MNLLLLEHTQKNFYTKIELGDKNSCRLTYLSRLDFQTCTTPRIMTSSGSIVEQTKEIVEAFVSFYAYLYTTRAHYTILELGDYLYNINLPILSPSQSLLLNTSLMDK